MINRIPYHLLFIGLAALAAFGPKRLVEVSRELAQGYHRLQEFKEEINEEMTTLTKDEPEEKPPS